MSFTDKYTLVQHSGAGYAGKPGFEHAVEERVLETKEVALVARVGGLIFNGYKEAADAAEAENYPDPELPVLYPQARGTFSDKTISGLKIYIPARS